MNVHSRYKMSNHVDVVEKVLRLYRRIYIKVEMYNVFFATVIFKNLSVFNLLYKKFLKQILKHEEVFMIFFKKKVIFLYWHRKKNNIFVFTELRLQFDLQRPSKCPTRQGHLSENLVNVQCRFSRLSITSFPFFQNVNLIIHH